MLCPEAQVRLPGVEVSSASSSALHRRPTEWREILARFRTSSQSKTKFCAQNAIARSTYIVGERRLSAHGRRHGGLSRTPPVTTPRSSRDVAAQERTAATFGARKGSDRRRKRHPGQSRQGFC